MAQTDPVVQTYEAAARLSRQMLVAAQRGEWEVLIDLENQRASVLSNMMAEKNRGAIPDSIAEQVLGLINSILAMDTETRALTVLWSGELHQLLGSIDTERKLSQAYGP
ncbi:MAG TPA: flagellar protein FliT [Novimethylophilus sp.]|jgi:hypothetical protein|uniref:flagellar protein FliT n=1 Tax=Novimethylophilus sp. TaxID=2137426 RepID=UPI002F40B60A